MLGQDIQRGVAVTLNHVYVTAVIKAKRRDLLQADRTSLQKQLEEIEVRRNLDRRQLIPLLERLDQESLYVPAPAGAGKSTFCRWAVLQAIAGAEMAHPIRAPEEFTESVPMNLRGRLPLLVPLREFWRSMDCGRGERTWYRTDLEKAVVAWVNRSPPEGLTGDLLKAHLKAGSAFLLLDGLDEVPPSEPRDSTTIYPRELLLSGLADALPDWQKADNRILLTSRPYGLGRGRAVDA